MRVLIVGGGSAGWIVANTLLSRLNGGGAGPLSITVLESPNTPRIGVGEATIPTVRNMIKGFGLSEADFMKSCDATHKHAIVFEDWQHKGSRYLHPFHRFSDSTTNTAVLRWLESDGTVPFSELVSAQDHLIATNRAPRPLNGPDFTGPVPYAYHMDAEMFADCLATHASNRGVKHVRAHVTSVERNSENGNVTALVCKDGQRIDADFYVDCTGFAAILSDSAQPDAEWVDQSDNLLCDRAVTMRVPREGAISENPPPTFTRATALDAGWCWDISLRTRRGRGYVYSSAHVSDEVAARTLCQQEGVDEAKADPRTLRFRVGRRAGAWVGNTVSIGLSANFLEPLESTGLYFADFAARVLCEMFPPTPASVSAPPLARRYNQLVREVHDQVLDFILLHYSVAGRRDTAFWRDASNVARLTDSLRKNLELWDIRPPSFADFPGRYSPFNHSNYEFIMLGSGWRPSGHPVPPMGTGRVATHIGSVAISRSLPSVSDFLSRLI